MQTASALLSRYRFSLRTVCESHTLPIRGLEFSVDGEFIHSSARADEGEAVETRAHRTFDGLRLDNYNDGGSRCVVVGEQAFARHDNEESSTPVDAIGALLAGAVKAEEQARRSAEEQAAREAEEKAKARRRARHSGSRFASPSVQPRRRLMPQMMMMSVTKIIQSLQRSSTVQQSNGAWGGGGGGGGGHLYASMRNDSCATRPFPFHRNSWSSLAGAPVLPLWRSDLGPRLSAAALSPSRPFLPLRTPWYFAHLPVPTPKCSRPFTLAMAHASTVASITWTADEGKIISVGVDRVVIIWRVL